MGSLPPSAQADPNIKEAQRKSFLKAQGKGRGLVRLWLATGDLAARVETASKVVKLTKDCYTPSALMRCEDAVGQLVASLLKLEKTQFMLNPFVKGLDDAWPCIASADDQELPAAAAAATTAAVTISDTDGNLDENSANTAGPAVADDLFSTPDVAASDGRLAGDDGLAFVDLSDDTSAIDLGTNEVSGTGTSKRSPTAVQTGDAEPAEITIAELEQALEGALQKCMVSTAANKKLKGELKLSTQQSEARIASLQEATKSADAEAEDAKYNLLLIKAEQKAMERLLDQMDSGEVSKAVEAEVLTVKYAKAIADLKKSRAINESLESQQNEANVIIQTLKEEVDSSAEVSSALKIEIEGKVAEIKNTTGKLSRTEEKLKTVEISRSTLREEFEASQTKLIALGTELGISKSESAHLKEKTSTVQSLQVQQASEAQTATGAMATELSSKKEEISKLQAAADATATMVASLKVELKQTKVSLQAATGERGSSVRQKRSSRVQTC